MTMPESLMRKGRRYYAECAYMEKRDALASIDTARNLIRTEQWHEAIDALADAIQDMMHACAMRSRSDAYAQCMSWMEDE